MLYGCAAELRWQLRFGTGATGVFRQIIRRKRVRHEAQSEAESEKCVGSWSVKATASGWCRVCEKQVSIIWELSWWKRSGAGSTDVSPDTRHGERPYDHYLAVRPPSTGTTCYHHRSATLTGREHRCKVKHEWGKKTKKAARRWAWAVLAFKPIPGEA